MDVMFIAEDKGALFIPVSDNFCEGCKLLALVNRLLSHALSIIVKRLKMNAAVFFFIGYY